MKHFQGLFCLCASMLLLSAGTRCMAGGPDGDVLRPERLRGTTWYLGFDAGLNYAQYFGTHAYRAGLMNQNYLISTWARFEGGNGFGFILNGTVDVPLSDKTGFVAKLGYIGRTDTYSSTFDNPIFYIDPATGFPDHATLTSELELSMQFVNIDLLLRYQLARKSWYVLGGLSIGLLQGSSGTFTQSIVSPDGVTYPAYTAAGGITPSGFRALEIRDVEIKEFEETRFAIKAGVGTWIPLSKSVFFTPELCLDFPLNAFLDQPGEALMFIPASDMRFMTVTLTAGLRFGL